MSKSPHRLRGDPAECWQAVLFGEILRAIDGPAIVREDATIRLPHSGRWESGLGRIAPALDDALGSTAFAVAWRWACAERQARAWPGLPRIARHATDAGVITGAGTALAWGLGLDGRTRIDTSGVGRTWRIELAGHITSISVVEPPARDWSPVDRIADVVAAWLDTPWSVTS